MITLLMHWTLLPNTALSLLFFFFFTFILSEITFSFLISVFFSSAKVAGIVGSICIFAAVMPRYAFFNTDPNEEILGKTLVSLLSPTAFTLGADVLLNYEGVNLGLTWSGIQDDSFSLFRVLLLMLFDTCLYGWLAWYLEHVFPTEFGERQPLWFCLKPSFWFKSWMEVRHDPPVEGDDVGCDPQFIEHVPASLASLRVRRHHQTTQSLQRGTWTLQHGHRRRAVAQPHLLRRADHGSPRTERRGQGTAARTPSASRSLGHSHQRRRWLLVTHRVPTCLCCAMCPAHVDHDNLYADGVDRAHQRRLSDVRQQHPRGHESDPQVAGGVQPAGRPLRPPVRVRAPALVRQPQGRGARGDGRRGRALPQLSAACPTSATRGRRSSAAVRSGSCASHSHSLEAAASASSTSPPRAWTRTAGAAPGTSSVSTRRAASSYSPRSPLITTPSSMPLHLPVSS